MYSRNLCRVSLGRSAKEMNFSDFYPKDKDFREHILDVQYLKREYLLLADD